MIFGKRRGDGVVIVEKKRHGGAAVAGRNRGVEAWRSGCEMKKRGLCFDHTKKRRTRKSKYLIKSIFMVL